MWLSENKVSILSKITKPFGGGKIFDNFEQPNNFYVLLD